MSLPPQIITSHFKGDTKISLTGEWRTSLWLSDIIHNLDNVKISSKNKNIIDLSLIKFLDTTAAYLLKNFLDRLGKKGILYELKEGPAPVMAILETITKIPLPSSLSARESSRLSGLFLLNSIGEKMIEASKTFLEALSFLGETTLSILNLFIYPTRLRFITLINLIHKVGVNALPIVGLISFLIGIVLVYQGADQLRRFGAEIFTINLLAVSVLRELGILLTAIVIAGRSGSAYTAQLGFMKLNQEVDALRVLGLNPMEVLVVPRILALLISLPLLTFFSDIMALIGGGLATYFLIGVGLTDFSKHFLLSIKVSTFWVGIIKAPVFAYFIGLTACFEGLRVTGGAESVGRHTTRSVVEGIFLVIVLDAAFSILFSLIGV